MEPVQQPTLGSDKQMQQGNTVAAAQEPAAQPAPFKPAEEVHQPSILSANVGEVSRVNEHLSKKGLTVKDLEYSQGNNLQNMLEAATYLVESGILPNHIESAEQVVAIAKLGSELGIPTMVAINNVHMIEGKASLNVHLIAALLKRAGWSYYIAADAQPFGNNDLYTTIVFVNTIKMDHYQRLLLKAEQYPVEARGAFVESLEEYRKTISQPFTYTYGEAVQMGLNTRSSWQKMHKVMLRSRCLTQGGRFVAPEVTLGMLETTEAAEIAHQEVQIDEEGTATLV